jgi:putative salt-induced outer membrane protein
MSRSSLRLFLAVLLAGGVAALHAEEPGAPKKPWSNKTELSVVSTNGNTKSTSASGKNTYTHDWNKASLELIGGGLSASDNEGTTAEQFYASEKGAYKITERNYAFERFAWDKDRFAGYSNRYDSSVGLGRELIKTDRDLLVTELGGGYVSEERIHADDKNYGAGRVYGKFEHKISPTSEFIQTVEYIPNLKDGDDFRVNTESSIQAAISTHFSLKTTYLWKHVSAPPVGFGRNDTSLTVALVASY